MTRRRILALIAALVLATAGASAADRYAAANGSGTACTNPAAGGTACSLHQCVCGTASGVAECTAGMVAGDTCWVLDGTYTNPGRFTKGLSCTSGSPCVLRAVNNATISTGATIVLTEADGGLGYWEFSDSDYWTIQGFRFLMNTGSAGDAAIAMNAGTNAKVQDNYWLLAHNSPGVFVLTTNQIGLTVQRNYARHDPVCQQTCTCGSTVDCDFGACAADGRIFSFDGDSGSLFLNNTYGYVRNLGILSDTTDFTGRGNRCINANNHGCLEIHNTDGLIWENNVFEEDVSGACAGGTGNSSSHISQGDMLDSYELHHAIIRNNTAVGHGYGPTAFIGIGQFPTVEGSGFSDIIITNNLLFDAGDSYMTDYPCLDLDTNLSGRWRDDYNLFNHCHLHGSPQRPVVRVGSTYYNFTTGQGANAPWANLGIGTQGQDRDGDGIREEIHGSNALPTFYDYGNYNYHAAGPASPQVNAGAPLGVGMCLRGTNNGNGCTSDADCPGTTVSTTTPQPTNAPVALPGKCYYFSSSTDFDGNLRGGTAGLPDIGAFEFQGSGSADTEPPTGVSNVSPTTGSLGVSLTPALTAAGPPAVQDATPPMLYAFELFNGATCAGSAVQSRGFATSTTWTPPTPLSPTTVYSWHNRAEDSVSPTPNVSGYSTCWSFTTAATSSDIACTERALEQAIIGLNTGARTSITFNCALLDDLGGSGTNVIPITPSHFNSRVVTGNGSAVTIDGGAGNIQFNMTPPWWVADAGFCASANCGAPCTQASETCLPTEGPTTSGSNQTNQWFLDIQQPGSILRNVTYRYFMEGVHASADNITVDGVTMVDAGDDNFSNYPAGSNFHSGILLQNSTVLRGNDKCVILYGDQVPGSSIYDVTVRNTTFTSCQQPVRTSGTSGRFFFDGNTFSDPINVAPYFMLGPRFGDTGDVSTTAAIIHWKGNAVHNARRGVRVTGWARFISEGQNIFDGTSSPFNTNRGLLCMDNARCVVAGDSFMESGGRSGIGGEPGEGGIAVAGSATVNAGGGPTMTLDGVPIGSLGGNVFTNNRSTSDPTQNFDNETSSVQFSAGNCWNDGDPSDEITPCAPIAGPNCSTVTYSPLASACGAFCGNGTVDSGEVCEGIGSCGTSGVVCGTNTCVTLGFTSGTLGCSACAWNTTGCLGVPGGVQGLYGGLCAGCGF